MPLISPGWAPTACRSPTVTLATWREQIAALVDAADAPVVLVGHSRSGIVISEVAEARPEKLARLAMAD